jgi:hypothetical protein
LWRTKSVRKMFPFPKILDGAIRHKIGMFAETTTQIPE